MPTIISKLGQKIDRYAFQVAHSRLNTVIQQVRQHKLTYLEEVALRDLTKVALECERQGIQGAIIEAGCALGGSAIALAAAKNPQRELSIYDVFGMIPPPSEQDDQDIHDRYAEIKTGKSEGIDGNLYYGYEDDLYNKVHQSFCEYGFSPEANNIHLVKGLFQDTMNIDQPIAMAHIDCDWFDSVMTCLNQIEPNLVAGGTLIIDDYNAWSGCKKAIDQYFQDKQSEYQFVQKSRLHIVKL
ncbi:TylF/MycF/NovP-related O-methyltransferase [Alkalinema pantanalense CENA528]|uniref:TylF/MycF/NovP-related O-methyltransferase n=1 Tax=Alkalinema pantanalense TaxID=1620705 RepID=UPI003D6E28CC